MKYSVSVVSYLNTIPFIYGLQRNHIIDRLDLTLDYPSVCAKKLFNNKIDIGLVPIVVLKDIKDQQIISNFCIGANGYVDTVCLLSDVNISEVESVLLDYQSKTSIELLKILFKDYWGISPTLFKAKPNYEEDIKGVKAGLIIGDRVFKYKANFKFCYDLSNIWKIHTGLPFVFACWVANKKIEEDFISDFNKALAYGIQNIEKATAASFEIYTHCKNPIDYLKNKISYNLDEKKKKAMDIFLKMI